MKRYSMLVTSGVIMIILLVLLASCSPELTPVVETASPSLDPSTTLPINPNGIRGHLIIESGRELVDVLFDPQAGEASYSPLVEGEDYAFSPDGKWLAYTQRSEDRTRVIAYPSGEVVADLPWASCFEWSPDSQKIAYYSEGEFKLMDVSGGNNWVIHRSLSDEYSLRGDPFDEEGITVYADLDCGGWVASNALVFHYRKEPMPFNLDSESRASVDSSSLVGFDFDGAPEGSEMKFRQLNEWWQPLAVSADGKWVVFTNDIERGYCPCYVAQDFTTSGTPEMIPVKPYFGTAQSRVIGFVGKNSDLLLERNGALYRYSIDFSAVMMEYLIPNSRGFYDPKSILVGEAEEAISVSGSEEIIDVTLIDLRTSDTLNFISLENPRNLGYGHLIYMDPVIWLPEEDVHLSQENEGREKVPGTTTTSPLDEATQWPLDFFDSFDDNTNDWSVGQRQVGSGQLERFIENGKYYWVLHTSEQNEILGVNSYLDSTANFITSIDARFVSGGYNNGTPFGIAFRRTDEGFFYIFVVNDTGFFTVSLYQNGWTPLINWTPTPAYKRGESNRLTVRAEGSKFDFWINDQHVGKVENNQLSEGYLGLVMEDNLGDVVVEFDNFEVRTP